MAKYTVLCTKKLLPSLIEEARKNGIEIMEQEFISVRPIGSEEKFTEIFNLFTKPYIAFTSSHAVTIADKYLHLHDTFYMVPWKIFCLGGKTKEAVLNAPVLEKDIIATAENARALAQKIMEHDVKEIVFFCGNKRRNELPDILNQNGIIVHEVVVYETVETPVTNTDAIDGIMFFSPSAVQSFFSVNQLSKRTVCFAIGKTTAGAIADFTDNRIITSESPSPEMLMACVQFYFQHINCYE